MGTGGSINWIMLNPSTADDVFDDPTIRKCIGFSKRWGFSSLCVTNLFSFRATDPRDLFKLAQTDYERAIGVNDAELITQAVDSDMVLAAWGDPGKLSNRATQVLDILGSMPIYCIGRTKSGHPKHPSRAAYTDSPELFRFASESA